MPTGFPFRFVRSQATFLAIALLHASAIAWIWQGAPNPHPTAPNVIKVSLISNHQKTEKKQTNPPEPVHKPERNNARKTPSAPVKPLKQVTKEIGAPQKDASPQEAAPQSAILELPKISRDPVSAQAETSSQKASTSVPVNLSLPLSDAAYLSNPKPEYPRLSRRFGEEGRVLIRLLILANGSAASAEIAKTSGYKRLDNAALKAVSHWKFVPAMRNGNPVDYWHEQPVIFELN